MLSSGGPAASSVSCVFGRWLLLGSCALGLLSCSACGGSGSRKTVVPELRGKTLPQAFRLLARGHLCAYPQMPITQVRTTGGPPIVVGQDPRPGARVDRSAYISVSVRARESGTLSLSDFPCSEH